MKKLRTIMSWMLAVAMIFTNITYVNATGTDSSSNTAVSEKGTSDGSEEELAYPNASTTASNTKTLTATFNYLDFKTKETIAPAQKFVFNSQNRTTSNMDIAIEGYTSYSVDYSEAENYLDMGYKQSSRPNPELEYPFSTIYDVWFGCTTLPASETTANINLYYMPSYNITINHYLDGEHISDKTSTAGPYFQGETAYIEATNLEQSDTTTATYYPVIGYFTDSCFLMESVNDGDTAEKTIGENDAEINFVYSSNPDDKTKTHANITVKSLFYSKTQELIDTMTETYSVPKQARYSFEPCVYDGFKVADSTAQTGTATQDTTITFKYTESNEYTVNITVHHQNSKGAEIETQQHALTSTPDKPTMYKITPLTKEEFVVLGEPSIIYNQELVSSTYDESDKSFTIRTNQNTKNTEVSVNYIYNTEPLINIEAVFVDAEGKPIEGTESINTTLTNANKSAEITLPTIEGYLFHDIQQETSNAGATVEIPDLAQEGSIIKITCDELAESFFSSYKFTITYVEKDVLQFYQVFDFKFDNKKDLGTVFMSSSSGTRVIKDYITPPTEKGFSFKGFLTAPVKEGDTLNFVNSIEHTDALTKECTEIYLFYQTKTTPEGLWVSEIAPQTYTGKAIKPIIQVYDSETLLTEKKDYTISYKNTTNASDASNAKTAPTIIVKGKGNYAGQETVTFQILGKDINSKDIRIGELSKAANNKIQKPVPDIRHNGKKLKNGKDFTVSFPDSVPGAYQAVGTYTVKIKGIGNFKGEKTIPLIITDKTLMSKVKVAKIKTQTFINKSIEPEVIATYKGNTLIKGVDYTLSFEDNIEVGKAKVILTGIGQYAGTKTVTFQIIGEDIAKATINGLTDKIYNTKEQTQNINVSLTGKTLKEGTDYTVSYSKNVNVGTAEIIITGIGGYSGKLKKTFKITAYDIATDSLDVIDITPAKNQLLKYTKGGVTPAVFVTYEADELVEKKDYTVKYVNNKKTGQRTDNKPPTVIITGKGNFKGTVTIPFSIINRNLESAENPISIKAPDIVYNAKPGKFMSKPIIIDTNGKKLVAGVDYDKNITYTKADGTVLTKADTPQVGDEITVSITGKGYYVGTISTTYKITKSSFNSAKIKVNAKAYTGNDVTLDAKDVTVTVGGTTLKYGQDYEIVADSYKNNTKKGIATVEIKGKGNYGGTKTVKFKITSKPFAWLQNLM